MSWHYQIRKRMVGDAVRFDIVEYYTDFAAWTENGMRPQGNTKSEVIRELERMLKDAKKYPILDDTKSEDEYGHRI